LFNGLAINCPAKPVYLHCRVRRRLSQHQNIVSLFTYLSGTTCSTSQCYTILPPSLRLTQHYTEE